MIMGCLAWFMNLRFRKQIILLNKSVPVSIKLANIFERTGLKQALAKAKANSKVLGEAFDRNLERKLTNHYWLSEWENEFGQAVSNRVLLNHNHILIVETYIDGNPSFQNMIYWEIKNGYFIEKRNNGTYVKYQAELLDDDTLKLSFLETNATDSIPLGTIFMYTRM